MKKILGAFLCLIALLFCFFQLMPQKTAKTVVLDGQGAAETENMNAIFP